MTTFTLIAAVAENGVIGDEGGIPWEYPEDLRRFKRLTTGHPVVLGRRTYEGIEARLGGPLPDRRNVVLSRSDPDVPGEVLLAESVDEAVELAEAAAEEMGVSEVFVAGGATVYEAFRPLSTRMELTEIHESHEGDTRFPSWDREDWREVQRDDREAFSFVTYERRS
ncbi:Dihydrofolate reductase [Halalkaliarchaeum sp. AArc-CO]|uniref:dihydrofolate reductase n=1 Tax=unclassified Halalkaliarchaeum TaxID=2678344 RepID=UPI00217DD176|nr:MULTISPECIES: dihydrofolate reductase [unclassified Halalkaliarchaeum]MDR5674045.1 dihydrofolate reductase [Halalkaliarchaeum sp. AArc-GB]UWG50775.1 Dihydrofolate reductase [Halalkaliarchaeum sp. AArc-CO]